MPLTELISWNVRSVVSGIGEGRIIDDSALESTVNSNEVSEKLSPSISIDAMYEPGIIGPNSILEPVSKSFS